MKRCQRHERNRVLTATLKAPSAGGICNFSKYCRWLAKQILALAESPMVTNK